MPGARSIKSYQAGEIPWGTVASLAVVGTGLRNPLSSVKGEEICYRVREAEPPFLESSVTFRIEPNHSGGTRLRIIHQIDHGQLRHSMYRAANSNRRCLMRAA